MLNEPDAVLTAIHRSGLAAEIGAGPIA